MADLKYLEILAHFFRSVIREFSQFTLPKPTGRNAHFSRALLKHRVRMSKFFHIFARDVSKISFSALNWRVAVRTRGQPFFWENFHNRAFRWHRAAETSIFSAIPIGIAAFWPGFDRDPALSHPCTHFHKKSSRNSLKNIQNCHTIFCEFSCKKSLKMRQIDKQETPQNLQKIDAFRTAVSYTHLTLPTKA